MINLAAFADVLAWSLIEVLWQGLVLWALRLALDPLLPARAVRLRYYLTAVAMAVIPAWWFASVVQTLITPAQTFALSAARDLGTITSILVLAWVVGVAVSAVRVGGGLLRWRRTIKQAVPVAVGRQRRFESLARRVGIRRRVRLLASTLVDLPCALGWFHPVVLVPLSLFTGFNPAQLEAILLHELVHIRRHDWLVGILQTIVEGLLFHVPFVWFLSARLRREREICCDDAAVEILGDRLSAGDTLGRVDSTGVSTGPHFHFEVRENGVPVDPLAFLE